MKKSLRIGGASGYWGDSAMAVPQFLAEGDLDYIVFDYLAEITMSIMARARTKDPAAGYAPDFVSAILRPHLAEIARQGVRIISNAGGVNPEACGAAARALIAELGIDLKVAVIAGDDLTARADEFAASGVEEMFTAAPFPAASSIASINAYLGAFPIAEALKAGADIVITGRVVDSAVTLAPCIAEFGWGADDFDRLAGGSLAGHLIECGAQATGGNFTDWRDVNDFVGIGYPIAEISPDGACVISKPRGSGGLVSKGTVAEQLVYEIGDPARYCLPDVTCDFSHVTVRDMAPDRVAVSGARGRAPTADYKVCATFEDGWRAGLMVSFIGEAARDKAEAFAAAAFERARALFRKFNAGDFTETSVEVIGADSQYGDFAAVCAPREVVLKIAARHPAAMGAGLLLKEIAGLGLAAPPGLTIFAGARPKPQPVVRLYSFLADKSAVAITIDSGDGPQPFNAPAPGFGTDGPTDPAPTPAVAPHTDDLVEVPLRQLAWARSGDKGDRANIGVIARIADAMPYIWAALDERTIASRFHHFIDGDARARVARYYMPGLPAMNILIDAVLGGGGVASLRNDPQGKAYAQILLDAPIPVPFTLAERLT